MLISVEKRFVFIANTKTASTSIEHVLHPYCEIERAGTPKRKHTPMQQVLEIYAPMFAEPEHDLAGYFKFGVMRDPIQWITSWYRYRKGNDVESPLPADLSFADFWARRDWNIASAEGRPNLQQSLFCGSDGGPLVDVIIPHHQLGPMFGEICDLLGIARPLERHNVSLLEDAGTVSPDLMAEMRAFYAQDYALFDQLDQINAAGMDRLRAR